MPTWKAVLVALRKILLGLIGDAIYAILASLVIGGILWFVIDFIFGAGVGFNVYVRWLWVILMFLDVVYTSIVNIWNLSYVFPATARRLAATFGEIWEAYDVHEMHKEKPMSQWDAEWFRRTLGIHRTAAAVAKQWTAMIFGGRGRNRF